MDIRAEVKERYNEKTIVIHRLTAESMEAAFAFELIKRWGMVSAIPDGEDSAGRQRGRLMEPSEMVDRAFECARQAYQRATEDGLILELPKIED